jgi:metal-responsive CopG/Arc/MetJ family transcriptional regulator
MHHRVQGGEKMRVNINIDDELLSKIDDYAKDKYINRTSAICVLLSNALQGNDINKGLASLKDYRDMLVQLDQSADK